MREKDRYRVAERRLTPYRQVAGAIYQAF